MTIESRRAQEKTQMRELILEAAKEIVIGEGFEGISIRKIAKKIQYSPSLIYHYFKNKEEILNQLMEIGYKRIVEALFSTNLKSKTLKDKLMEMTRKYIDIALSMPEGCLEYEYYFKNSFISIVRVFSDYGKHCFVYLKGLIQKKTLN